MRIIAGRWRGRKLAAPAGVTTRPTSDRAREALFSMLTSRIGSFEGLRVADLFAGSGALGLEALSRGAGHCVFVDNDRAAVEAIRANVAALGAEAEILQRAAEHLRPDAPVDLVFLDPPYRSGLFLPALENLPLAPGGFACVETEADEAVELPGYAIEAVHRHGKARLTLLRRP
jgi:16S rRNA (guanine966-N2)-methyltransferase